MAFVATLDRIDKVKNVEDEMMKFCKLLALQVTTFFS